MKKIIAALSFSMLLAIGANAQEAIKSVAEISKAQVDKVMALTDLTEETEVLLYRQIYTYNDNISRLDRMKGSDEDKAAMLQAQTERYHEAVKNLLSQDQYTAFLQVFKQDEKKAVKRK